MAALSVFVGPPYLPSRRSEAIAERSRGTLSFVPLLALIPNQHDIRVRMPPHQSQRLSIGRPGKHTDVVCLKLSLPLTRRPIQRLPPQIIHPVLADRIFNRLPIRRVSNVSAVWFLQRNLPFHLSPLGCDFHHVLLMSLGVAHSGKGRSRSIGRKVVPRLHLQI